MDEESETQREETLKEEIKAQMSAAEITNIKIENVTDHVKPLVYFLSRALSRLCATHG